MTEKNGKMPGRTANTPRRVKPLCFDLNEFFINKKLNMQIYEEF
jgi:hypothetical protein